MEKIIGFIHVYAVNNYKQIVENQVREIFDSGLYEAVEKIWYVVIGDNEFRIPGDKYHLLAQSLNLDLSENFTLNMLRMEVLLSKTDFKLFYIHTKGVTKPKSKQLEFWRLFMEYFNISCWVYCLEALDQADIAGVNRRVYAKKRVHFSGNFWWANSKYIRRLPQLSKEGYGREVNRWDGEFWIGDGNPTSVQLWNSRVHMATQQYSPNYYKGKSPQMYFFDKK